MAKKKEKYSLESPEVPHQLSESEVLYWLRNKKIDYSYLNLLKASSMMPDEVLAGWLNISVKTLRNYRNPKNKIRDNIKEQILLLIAIYRHGNDVFGDEARFNQWLNTENFFFDKSAPATLFNTISGIRFVDNRLSAMEHGDNI